jgi:hypothetical protein
VSNFNIIPSSLKKETEGPFEGRAGGKGLKMDGPIRSPYLRWASCHTVGRPFCVVSLYVARTLVAHFAVRVCGWLLLFWLANILMKETPCHSARSSISVDQMTSEFFL